MVSIHTMFEDHIAAGYLLPERENEVVSDLGPHSGDTEASQACGEKVASFESLGERSLV